MAASVGCWFASLAWVDVVWVEWLLVAESIGAGRHRSRDQLRSRQANRAAEDEASQQGSWGRRRPAAGSEIARHERLSPMMTAGATCCFIMSVPK